MSTITHYIVYTHTFTIPCSQSAPQFPDGHACTVIADLFFNGTLPDIFVTSLSQRRSYVCRFEDTQKDVTYRLQLWSTEEDDRFVYATYSIRIPYDETPSIPVQQAIPPAQWFVHPNHSAFYQYTRYLTLSSTLETSDVTMSDLSSMDDWVELCTEDIVD